MKVCKYIADGFMADATKLLSEFSSKKSLEFSAFAEVWRNNHFSFIYALRENLKELNEFTQEIFRMTEQFWSSDNLWTSFGGIYLLYALYRNQIVKPPFQIRITKSQYVNIMGLQNKAQAEGVNSLHYVLNYLLEHCFQLVAFPTLMGPNLRKYGKRDSKGQWQTESVVFSSLDDALVGQLQDLSQMYSEYSTYRPNCHWSHSGDVCKKFISDLNRIKRNFISSKTQVYSEESRGLPSQKAVSSATKSYKIGSRRSQLKAESFERNVLPFLDPYYYTHDNEDVCLSANTEVNLSTENSVAQNKPTTKQTRRKANKKEKKRRKLIEPKSSKQNKRGKFQRTARIRRYYNNADFKEDSIIPDANAAFGGKECEDELLYTQIQNFLDINMDDSDVDDLCNNTEGIVKGGEQFLEDNYPVSDEYLDLCF